jgi:hypothetical protein
MDKTKDSKRSKNLMKETAGKLGLAMDGTAGNSTDFPDFQYEQTLVGHHAYTWEDAMTKEMIRITVKHPLRTGRDFHCELSVAFRPNGDARLRSVLVDKHWNLKSTNSTDTQIRSLNKRLDNYGWDRRLSMVEEHLQESAMVGEPTIDLSLVESPPPEKYAVWPFVEHDAHNIIGAHGGSTKSIMAMAIAISYSYGVPVLPGTKVPLEPKAVLYLDYEASSAKAAYRRRQLLEGMHMSEQSGKVYYKKMTSLIQDASREIQEIIMSRNIGLVIIDSVSRAVGGETSTENVVIPYFNTTSSWNVTILGIAHKAKDPESNGPAGVAQWWNQARNYWEIEKEQAPGDSRVHVSIRHDKSNDSGLYEPMHYSVEFSNEDAPTIRYHRKDSATADNSDKMALYTRIKEYLKGNPGSTVNQIAEGIGYHSENGIRNSMKTYEGTLFYGTQEARNRRWSLVEQIENKRGQIENIIDEEDDWKF